MHFVALFTAAEKLLQGAGAGGGSRFLIRFDLSSSATSK
jgi:hypothetical protein